MAGGLWVLGLVALVSAEGTTLSLDQALDNARKHHPQVKYAQSQVDVMDARIIQQRAGMLPTLGASALYERTTANFVLQPGFLPTSVINNPNNVTSVTKPRFNDRSYNYWRFALNANLLIFDFGETPKRWLASKSTYDAQREAENVTFLTVLLNVRTAFFNARAMKDLVKVAQSTVDNQAKHLEQIEGFVQVGTRDLIDLAQAKTDFANARVQVITAQNNYDNAKATLNQAMGMEMSTDYDVSDELMPVVPNEDRSTDELMRIALENRPEFAQYRAQVAAQQYTLESTWANYWPNLNATGLLTDAGMDLSEPGVNWQVALVLSWPLFAGGLNYGQVQEASATLAGIHAQMELTRQQIRLEVEQARLSVRAAKATLEASGEALYNAQEQLRMAEGRYGTGAGGVIELGDAQVAATSAAAQQVQAQQALASARATLLKALGRL